MRINRAALAAIVLAGLPAAAAAGPIEFSFTTLGTSGPPPLGPSPGWLDFSLARAGTPAVAPVGQPYALGGVRFGPSPGPQGTEETGGYVTGRSFRVAVTVTDAATGRTGTLAVDGDAHDAWDYRASDKRWTPAYHYLSIWGAAPGEPFATSEVIGATRYTLTAAPDPREADTVVLFTLGAAAAAPEPGTFVLAATALAPVGAAAARRYLRRRRA